MRFSWFCLCHIYIQFVWLHCMSLDPWVFFLFVYCGHICIHLVWLSLSFSFEAVTPTFPNAKEHSDLWLIWQPRGPHKFVFDKNCWFGNELCALWMYVLLSNLTFVCILLHTFMNMYFTKISEIPCNLLKMCPSLF